jgi:hypothetical protein
MKEATLPLLRPTGRGKGYFSGLRAIDAQIGAALREEALGHKVGTGLTLGTCARLALRYRLKMAALFTLLEDANIIPAGSYDNLRRSNMRYGDGYARFAPLRLFAEYIARNGLPEAAPGCEEPLCTL